MKICNKLSIFFLKHKKLNKFFEENEINESFKNLIVKILMVRKNDLNDYLKNKVTNMDRMQLKDFDWTVKVYLLL
jgi:hypothetical protein